MRILRSDGFGVDLVLNFLSSQSQMDALILKEIKDALDARNMVLHNAVVVAHAYMAAGTTNTAFLREHLEWMGKASNWAKFAATASIGVVHAGHVKQSMALLQPYLPSGGLSTSPYSEGGALYGARPHPREPLGRRRERDRELPLRRAAQRGQRRDRAARRVPRARARGDGDGQRGALRRAQDRALLRHGGRRRGRRAGLGLLLLGHGTSTELSRAALAELVAYAHDTAHEKIIRALGLSAGLIVAGCEEQAEPVIEQLARDRDPILRYGGMFAIALAYAGTSHNAATRRLLHVAVSDVSDDVRRAAVMSLGLVLFRDPEKVPKLVALLAESFNPHVRYGVCLALGFACAGSGDADALALLEPMMAERPTSCGRARSSARRWCSCSRARRARRASRPSARS